ncbi:hypothetical protein [Microbispora bryophytorum]|uniref:Uncharacterized protein n=1 Tax=Microbispora bryophytorum TaxID=1460882 RepID=A0A8H9H477_9ACTN|nr:hypothetical protein [Microbispora bryophytorum]MBD3139764.1 hypothetical protein [Microbispora bryophytorum]TQS02684.1 hypothetical protein FLX07_27620 [Microbispora bryophytorum]GGO27435.1 hypothetical protein GCM10011574_60850 [Microbispora bryophytorum]
MTAAAPGRGRGEQGGQGGQSGQDRLTPPDPTGLEAWIRQVLGLAGARASAFAPPLPTTPLLPTAPPLPTAPSAGPDPDGQAE